MTRPFAVPLLLFVTACGSPQDTDWTAQFGDPGSQFTGPDGQYRGPTLVDQVWLDCDPDTPTWYYTIYTYGWASDATVRVNRWYPDETETHHLPMAERGENGQWERRSLALPVVDDQMGVPDESTELDCDWSYDTWRMGVYDPEGVESDCVVFGYDARGLDPQRRCRELVLAGG